MEYKEFASDLSNQDRFIFRSTQQSNETMHSFGINQTVRQTGKGQFRSDFIARSSPQADFFSDRFNKSATIGLECPNYCVGFLFPCSANGEFRVSGQSVGTDELVVLASGQQTDIFFSGFGGSDCIGIRATKFDTLFGTLCPDLVCVERSEQLIIKGSREQLHQLKLATLAAVNGESATSEEDVEYLLSRMATWIDENGQSNGAAATHTRAARARIAKMTQEYLEEYYPEKISTEMICHAIGTSARTLQRSFLEQFGITISDYLLSIRLEAARRCLAVSQVGEETVANIALSHGLSHLGRFSIQYRERFDELPSSTLAGS